MPDLAVQKDKIHRLRLPAIFEAHSSYYDSTFNLVPNYGDLARGDSVDGHGIAGVEGVRTGLLTVNNYYSDKPHLPTHLEHMPCANPWFEFQAREYCAHRNQYDLNNAKVDPFGNTTCSSMTVAKNFTHMTWAFLRNSTMTGVHRKRRSDQSLINNEPYNENYPQADSKRSPVSALWSTLSYSDSPETVLFLRKLPELTSDWVRLAFPLRLSKSYDTVEPAISNTISICPVYNPRYVKIDGSKNQILGKENDHIGDTFLNTTPWCDYGDKPLVYWHHAGNQQLGIVIDYYNSLNPPSLDNQSNTTVRGPNFDDGRAQVMTQTNNALYVSGCDLTGTFQQYGQPDENIVVQNEEGTYVFADNPVYLDFQADRARNGLRQIGRIQFGSQPIGDYKTNNNQVFFDTTRHNFFRTESVREYNNEYATHPLVRTIEINAERKYETQETVDGVVKVYYEHEKRILEQGIFFRNSCTTGSDVDPIHNHQYQDSQNFAPSALVNATPFKPTYLSFNRADYVDYSERCIHPDYAQIFDPYTIHQLARAPGELELINTSSIRGTDRDGDPVLFRRNKGPGFPTSDGNDPPITHAQFKAYSPTGIGTINIIQNDDFMKTNEMIFSAWYKKDGDQTLIWGCQLENRDQNARYEDMGEILDFEAPIPNLSTSTRDFGANTIYAKCIKNYNGPFNSGLNPRGEVKPPFLWCGDSELSKFGPVWQPKLTNNNLSSTIPHNNFPARYNTRIVTITGGFTFNGIFYPEGEDVQFGLRFQRNLDSPATNRDGVTEILDTVRMGIQFGDFSYNEKTSYTDVANHPMIDNKVTGLFDRVKATSHPEYNKNHMLPSSATNFHQVRSYKYGGYTFRRRGLSGVLDLNAGITSEGFVASPTKMRLEEINAFGSAITQVIGLNNLDTRSTTYTRYQYSKDAKAFATKSTERGTLKVLDLRGTNIEYNSLPLGAAGKSDFTNRTTNSLNIFRASDSPNVIVSSIAHLKLNGTFPILGTNLETFSIGGQSCALTERTFNSMFVDNFVFNEEVYAGQYNVRRPKHLKLTEDPRIEQRTTTFVADDDTDPLYDGFAEFQTFTKYFYSEQKDPILYTQSRPTDFMPFFHYRQKIASLKIFGTGNELGTQLPIPPDSLESLNVDNCRTITGFEPSRHLPNSYQYNTLTARGATFTVSGYYDPNNLRSLSAKGCPLTTGAKLSILLGFYGRNVDNPFRFAGFNGVNPDYDGANYNKNRFINLDVNNGGAPDGSVYGWYNQGHPNYKHRYSRTGYWDYSNYPNGRYKNFLPQNRPLVAVNKNNIFTHTTDVTYRARTNPPSPSVTRYLPVDTAGVIRFINIGQTSNDQAQNFDILKTVETTYTEHVVTSDINSLTESASKTYNEDSTRHLVEWPNKNLWSNGMTGRNQSPLDQERVYRAQAPQYLSRGVLSKGDGSEYGNGPNIHICMLRNDNAMHLRGRRNFAEPLQGVGTDTRIRATGRGIETSINNLDSYSCPLLIDLRKYGNPESATITSVYDHSTNPTSNMDAYILWSQYADNTLADNPFNAGYHGQTYGGMIQSLTSAGFTVLL